MNYPMKQMNLVVEGFYWPLLVSSENAPSDAENKRLLHWLKDILPNE